MLRNVSFFHFLGKAKWGGFAMDSVMSVLDTAGSTVLQTVSSLSSLSANVDPLDWAFSANKKTYGLPMDASLAAAILVAIGAKLEIRSGLLFLLFSFFVFLLSIPSSSSHTILLFRLL